MLIENPALWLIGDPHLGRRFETGVPLHRRGERERNQLAKFKQELATPGVSTVVGMGDLFDHPHVGYSVVLAAYEAVRDAPCEVVILGGNHDEPRNLSVVGAFQLFEKLCEPLRHVTVVSREPQVIDGVAYFPWDWTTSAVEQVAKVRCVAGVKVAIGHWDLISFGGDESHIAPVKALQEAFGPDIRIYTGHYHLEGEYQVEGVPVLCTGSLEPYSHAEDPQGDLYISLTLAELESYAGDLKNKCVRVFLSEGEELPADLDCLALTAKRVRSEELELEQISLDHFSWKEVLSSALEPLAPHVQEFIHDRFAELDQG